MFVITWTINSTLFIYVCQFPFYDCTYTKKNVMNSEKKTLKFIGGYKFKFYTFLKK